MHIFRFRLDETVTLQSILFTYFTLKMFSLLIAKDRNKHTSSKWKSWKSQKLVGGQKTFIFWGGRGCPMRVSWKTFHIQGKRVASLRGGGRGVISRWRLIPIWTLCVWSFWNSNKSLKSHNSGIMTHKTYCLGPEN